MTRGRFITLEGGEGVGKSTQLRSLAAAIEACGIDVVATREPGGSAGAEAIRGLLLSGRARPLGVLGEAYLFAADGYAVRIRLQGPAPDRLNGTAAELVGALGDDAIGTMTAKGPAAGGTRYEAERDLDPTVAGQIVARAEHVVTKVRYSAWLAGFHRGGAVLSP